jgi:hypothetical protein
MQRIIKTTGIHILIIILVIYFYSAVISAVLSGGISLIQLPETKFNPSGQLLHK